MNHRTKPKLIATSVALASLLSFCPLVAQASADAESEFHMPTRTFAGAFLAGNAAREGFDFGAAARFYDQALRFDPENLGLRRELMLSLVTDGQIAAALPHAEMLIDEPDAGRVARLVLGTDALRESRYLDADELLDLASQNDLERLLTGVMRAWARHGAGNTDAALDLVDDLDGPDWYALFAGYHGALIAEAAGRPDDAAARYAAVMEDAAGGSASPLTYLRLAEAHARFLARNGKLEEARAMIDRGLGTAPNNPDLLALATTIDTPQGSRATIDTPQLGGGEILLNLGSAINRDGAEDFAALYLELGRKVAPRNAQILFELGGIAERLGQPERAIRYYAGVPDDSPLARIAALQRGLALADLERHDESVATLQALIEDSPDDFRGYLALGGVQASERNFEEAAKVYEQAMERLDLSEPRFWQMHYRLGIAYERTDRWPEAEETFKRALELSPDQPDVLNYLGYSWIDMNMNLDEGIEMIRTAVEQRPRDGYIVDSLGWAYYRLGNFDNAVEHLETASDLRPRDSIINDHLGDAYWRVGRKLEATYQWSRALTMDGEEEELAKIRAKLEAADTPGMEPEIASSRVDNGAFEQASETSADDG